jgi:competence protein ComEA
VAVLSRSVIFATILAVLYPTANYAAEGMKTSTAAPGIRPTRVKPLDINSGPIEDLKALPGINDAYAQKIVAGRPYEKRDDLVSRKILPPSTYKKIKDRIITVETGQIPIDSY